MSRSVSPATAWVLGFLGVLVASAMVVGGFALMTGAQPARTDEPVTAGGSAEPAAGAASDPPAEPTPRSGGGDPAAGPSTDPVRQPVRKPQVQVPQGPRTRTAVAAYFLGETPAGPRLYREFQSQLVCARPLCRVYAGVRTAVAGGPDDPDYRSAWPAGTDVASVRLADGQVTVDLRSPRSGLRDRPRRLSPAEAALAVEQVVYSAQAGLGGRVPVQLLVDGRRTDRVLGQPASEPLAEGAALRTLAPMSISDPEEGKTVAGLFEISGVNNGFEATVVVEVRRAGRVVESAFGTAAGWGGDQLYPWTVDIDLSALTPGSYILVARNDDPTAGAEGHGPAVDTRTIVVE